MHLFRRAGTSNALFFNGVQEDLVTRDFTVKYLDWIADRIVELSCFPSPRKLTQGGDDLHLESGHPWWKMSARDRQKFLLPLATDIWDTHGNSGAADRNYHSDINTRPRIANYWNDGFTYQVNSLVKHSYEC